MIVEEQIVLQYALPHFNREDASCWCEEAECQRQVNWDRVLELALFHDVLPSVYRHLEDTGWLAVPDGAVRKFREKWHQHLARNLILSHELDRVLELFAKNGVKAIPLKGVLLAGLFYPDITLRSFSDLDIWVRPMDLKEAGEILQQTGYSPLFILDQDYSAENVCDILFHRCLPTGSRIGIELHQGLAKPRDYPAIPEEKWWHQAQEVWINGQHYFSLALEDMLIYLALKIHASAYCYLKQFVDLYQIVYLWGNKLDWKYIRRTAQETRMVNNLSFALLTIRNLFGSYTTQYGAPMTQHGSYTTQHGAPMTPHSSYTTYHGSHTTWHSSYKTQHEIEHDQIEHDQIEHDQSVRPIMGALRLHVLERIFNRQTILSGRYGRDLRRGFCLLLNDRLTDSIASSLRTLFPSTGAICARYLILPHSKKVYLYCCLNPFLVMYWLVRGSLIKSSDGDGLGTLLGPLNQ